MRGILSSYFTKLISTMLRFWPLPPQNTRVARQILFAPQRILNSFKMNRDSDYLCYQSWRLTQAICLGLLIILSIDIFFELGLFIDKNAVSSKKIVFAVTWLNLAGKCALILAFAFYLRIRLSVDLKNDLVPFLVKGEVFSRLSRREWTQTSALILFMVFLVCGYSGSAAGGLMKMYNLENNTLAVVIEVLALAYLLPFLVPFGISHALILEKSLRFFPDAQKNLAEW